MPSTSDSGRHTPKKHPAEPVGEPIDFSKPAHKDTMVMVPLNMLRWLQIGLDEGRVAASPYPAKDEAVYQQLADAIEHGTEIERMSVMPGKN